MNFSLDLKHIIGALVISCFTFLASTFWSNQSEIVIIKQQIEVVSKMLSEIRQDQREAQKLYALKTDLTRLEDRVSNIENRQRK